MEKNLVRHRSANIVVVLAAAVFGLLLFGWSTIASPAGAQTSDSDTESRSATAQAAHVAVVVVGASDEESTSISSAVAEVQGVVSVSADSSTDDALVLFIRTDQAQTDADSLTSLGVDVSAAVKAVSPQSEVQVGGELLAEDQIKRRFATSSLFIGLSVLLASAAIAAIFGWRRGVVAAGSIAVAVGVAAEFGSEIAGNFNGTIASTSLPAVLVGAVVAVVVSLRILAWSDRPRHGDGASQIRSSIAEIGPEVAMVIASLLVLSGVAELIQSGRSALTVAAIGAAVSALTIFTLVPAGLVLLDGVGPAESDSEPSETNEQGSASQLPINIPDGADQPLLFLAAGAVLLAAFAAFAFGNPGREFLSSDSLPADMAQAMVGERLAEVGDETAPVRAAFDSSVDLETVDKWAVAAADLPNVVRVHTASGTFGTGGLSEDNSFPPEAFEGPVPMAFVVPSVISRSDTAQEMVRDLAALDSSTGNPRLSGPSVDATADGPSRTDLIMLIVVAALLVGLGVMANTQSRAFALTAGLLRLLFGAASIGLYRLVIPGATGAELALVLAITTTLAALFDFEFLEHVFTKRGARPKSFLLQNLGETSLIGIAFLGLGCLMLLVAAVFGGGPTAGRLGFGLVFVALLEGPMGGLVACPALLGQRGAFHSVARPMRVALTSAKRVPSPDEVDGDPHWKRVVSDLLQSEYQLQVNPEAADVSRVFVTDTPLARQAAVQSQSLHDAGLRISGRGPKLRRVTTMSQQSPISLGVIVEHPARQLVDVDGEVVGVRKAELKRGVLWLMERTDGTFRIAESVELESSDLPDSSEDLSFSSESITDLTDSPTIVVADGEAELSLTDGAEQSPKTAKPSQASVAHQTTTTIGSEPERS